jgi:hypothetical protein
MAGAAEGSKARAFGRSLGDFGKLSRAETKVVAAARKGQTRIFGTRIPATPEEKKQRTVRAGLVRFLVLGGDDASPVHEKGVRIQGAVIDGDLDLGGCTLVGDLSLLNCELAALFLLRGARTRTIDLSGSCCRDIDADRVEVSGSIFFRNGFVAAGAVRLLLADITGNLVCDGAYFIGDKGGNALSCDEIEIGGSAFLRRCTATTGSVRLPGAQIVGDLDCAGGHFEGSDRNGTALQCDRINVGGSVLLGLGFAAAGVVRLPGSKIAVDVDCVGGTFGKTASTTVGRASKEAVLVLERITVEGTLWLTPRELIKTVNTTTFYGGVSLTSAKINRIVDAVKEDPKRRAPYVSAVVANENPAFLRLDGFSYDRFGDPTKLTARARIAFLRLQQPSDLGEKFKPQPWTQMAKVLREMGHEDAAKDVAIEQQRASRRAGVKTGPWHPIYGVLYGYGYRPMWLGAWAIGVVLVFAGFFWLAAANGVMGPTDSRIFDDGRYAHCRARVSVNWTKCKELEFRYTVFNPLLYSLELVVPIVGAKQTKDWAPMTVVPCAEKGWFDICRRIADVPNRSAAIEPMPGYSLLGIGVAFLAFLENLFGWLAGLMFVAVASGLIKKD